ncbi:hypothetical protein HJC23_004389 [Cyclotella cryptica]|uniref:Chalcone isomerase domain-containing protein n=1 Tax=Cyclotella cryptica TaxID=29204 RepID=A0ABD3PI96_9STRA|eukprot:CCRYP_014579-RA/>CCRYP_014579-RA protein AED:0.01 eAED:0.01 QI:0/-1/0/1/-1/1/1/0/231
MGSSAKLLLPTLAVVIAILAVVIGPKYLSPEPPNSIISNQVIDGISFPSSVKIAGSAQKFIGGGTRFKWGFKVYALGIYGEDKTIKSMTKKYAGASMEGLMKSDTLFTDFSESKSAKTLLLRFHREVGSSDVADALGEALKPRLGEKESESFQTFILDVVGGERVQKGSDIFITCKGEKLWASTTGGSDNASSITMKGLCPAIFMVYLGENPVSPHAKEGFVKGFETMTNK